MPNNDFITFGSVVMLQQYFGNADVPTTKIRIYKQLYGIYS